MKCQPNLILLLRQSEILDDVTLWFNTSHLAYHGVSWENVLFATCVSHAAGIPYHTGKNNASLSWEYLFQSDVCWQTHKFLALPERSSNELPEREMLKWHSSASIFRKQPWLCSLLSEIEQIFSLQNCTEIKNINFEAQPYLLLLPPKQPFTFICLPLLSFGIPPLVCYEVMLCRQTVHLVERGLTRCILLKYVKRD